MNHIKFFALSATLFCCFSFGILHHGWSNYDQSKKLDYTGSIVESAYENPHATAKVKYKNKTWTVILAPVSRLEARGVSAEMIKKDASIRVVGYPHKQVKDEMRAERIFIGDKKFELR